MAMTIDHKCGATRTVAKTKVQMTLPLGFETGLRPGNVPRQISEPPHPEWTRGWLIAAP
jgi:hypothetical protein